ncbi:hypothetical protein BJV78DRAFT_258988 [Lactifluus subvellereus]|nr:hypothetical protein BJV78DRAFT_258988 [Lactifluus subvellereus]
MLSSDTGYSSDGSIDLMYSVYSEHKRSRSSSLNFSAWSRGPSRSPSPVTSDSESRAPVVQRGRRFARRTRSPPQSTISKLPDHILCDIFTFYGENVFSEPGGHRFWWHTLALVCRKWNTVIGIYRSHFLDELRFGSDSTTRFLTNISSRGGVSVTSRLRRWHLLPLHLHYDLIQPSLGAGEDEDDILVLLQHLERIYFLSLLAPLPTWRSIAAAASDPPLSCTSIEHIHLDTGNRTTGFVLPSTFLAGHSPRLRALTMIGVFPRSLRSLLLSPIHLTTLVLDGIPDSSHLPPEVLLGYLGLMLQLQYLNIGFLSSVPNPRGGGRRPAFAPLGRVVLSNLIWFYFRGVCAYLEALVTLLDTPHVREIYFILFHQLRYPIPRLSAFLRRTKRYGFDGIRIHFDLQYAKISAVPAFSPSTGEKLIIRLPCNHPDFQVASIAQVCRALRPNFANMEDLFIKYHQSQWPAEWHGEVEPALWSELLAQFLNMKTLWLSSALVSEVTQAIRSSVQQLLEEMPIFAWIIVEVQEDDASIAAVQSLSDLLIEIRRSGGPVIELYRLIPDMWNQRTLPQG